MHSPTGSQNISYLDEVRRVLGAYKRRTVDFIMVEEGQRALDVGCGTGDDVRDLAGLVGVNGRVVGIDHSSDMIAEARRRFCDSGLPIEFIEAEAESLPQPDGAFDRCRADRVFQHLPQPRAALAEMIRVTARNGWVAAFDVDWGTLAIDHDDHQLTRKLINYSCDHLVNGWAGRRLFGLFRRSGLTNVELITETLCLTQWRSADSVLGVTTQTNRAVKAGAVSEKDARRWLDSLEERDAAGCFFSSICGLGVRGQKMI
jgi:ubiquinone/menaquinone biosynthesis C-methylase UbiE